MAEISNSWCSTEAHSTCCDPEAKDTCCGPEAKDTCCREAAAGRTCGCSEGQPDIRETHRVHERPSTAVVRTRAA